MTNLLALIEELIEMGYTPEEAEELAASMMGLNDYE